MSTQIEIEGTESPDRDPELHALWLELVDLQEASAAAKAAEAKKREEAGAALKARGLTEYSVDGAALWIEPHDKVKAKKPGARKRGKIKKVKKGDAEDGAE
jgi:uncharacterized protein YggE